MKDLDVWEIASRIEKTEVPRVRKELEELVDSFSGQSMDFNQILTEVIGPMIRISNSGSKTFTIKVLQEVVNELKNSDSNQ
jgi:hypothetical protein